MIFVNFAIYAIFHDFFTEYSSSKRRHLAAICGKIETKIDLSLLVDFPGPFDLNQTVKITVKAFGYYDKIMDGFQLDSLNVTSNEIIFGTIPMTRKHNEVLLQIDLDYEMSKFGLMELNVVEVNNDFFMICQSTTR